MNINHRILREFKIVDAGDAYFRCLEFEKDVQLDMERSSNDLETGLRRSLHSTNSIKSTKNRKRVRNETNSHSEPFFTRTRFIL